MALMDESVWPGKIKIYSGGWGRRGADRRGR
jgi:hypothetical protein